MSGNASGHRQRAVMASDAEWEIIGQVAKRGGMDRSRYLIHRALMPDALSTEVLLRRAVRELLVLSLVERAAPARGGGGTGVGGHLRRGGCVDRQRGRIGAPDGPGRGEPLEGAGRGAGGEGRGVTEEDPKRARSLHLSLADQTRLREAADGGRQEELGVRAGSYRCGRPRPPSGGADARRAGGAAGRGSRDAGVPAGGEGRACRKRARPAGGAHRPCRE